MNGKDWNEVDEGMATAQEPVTLLCMSLKCLSPGAELCIRRERQLDMGRWWVDRKKEERLLCCLHR